jgi:putative oxidoreductase
MQIQDTRQARDYFAQKLAFVTGPFELDGQIKRKEPITVVDVRLPSDYRAGHIPGAINLPQGKWHTLAGLSKDRGGRGRRIRLGRHCSRGDGRRLRGLAEKQSAGRAVRSAIMNTAVMKTPALVGDTLLRVALGLMFIAHSVLLKYFTFTLAGTAQYFDSIGLPGSLAYVVFALEAIGGVLLVLNIATRWVALALVPVLLGAMWVHLGNGWVFSAPNGGWEYPLFLIVISVVVALQSYGSSRSPSGGGN